jgi:hypothetical protein
MTGSLRIAGAVARVHGGSLDCVRCLPLLVSKCKIRPSELSCPAEHLAILVRLTDLTHHRNRVDTGATNIDLIRIFILVGICVATALVLPKVVVTVLDIFAVFFIPNANGTFLPCYLSSHLVISKQHSFLIMKPFTSSSLPSPYSFVFFLEKKSMKSINSIKSRKAIGTA